ncbi:putative xyloglucan endotransglucosylase/hydrolase protein 1 [Lycium ferocissimum]|uniref:putative xyloglucan endotransglucosylase/hydrolase protein 1 n=1 Tax=Lycium ferocissimum TaxID=112874 RepID=UPI002815B22A|nr:putative xyloglucan endotransglucosylase/hydrolase protein 1 [Lycium ferocissimum]
MTGCISLSMASFGLMSIIICILLFFALAPINAMVDFNQNYYPLWGQNHITFLNQSTAVQLLLDRNSGAGFRSKLQYESGLFTIRMKIPDKKTNGVITTFYLISDDQAQGVSHDEIDFEFVGTEGKLQTNLFANDMGGREEVYQLPFDPSEDYHTYQILYSPYRIVFFVDNIPVRTFKNNTNRGINFPTKPMWIEGSLWYSQSLWAGSINWNREPFIAYYQDFDISGCPYQSDSNCMSPVLYPWVRPKLDLKQLQVMRNFRRRHMVYSYCRHNRGRFPECVHQSA